MAMIFRLFFSPDGAFDQFLNVLHLSRFQTFWLGDPDQVNITLASISLWRNLGISFLYTTEPFKAFLKIIRKFVY